MRKSRLEDKKLSFDFVLHVVKSVKRHISEFFVLIALLHSPYPPVKDLLVRRCTVHGLQHPRDSTPVTGDSSDSYPESSTSPENIGNWNE